MGKVHWPERNDLTVRQIWRSATRLLTRPGVDDSLVALQLRSRVRDAARHHTYLDGFPLTVAPRSMLGSDGV